MKVNKLTSTKTQLPYSYYSVPYCHPDKIVDSAENLGEVLRGDRIENSPYVVSLNVEMIWFAILGISYGYLVADQICLLQFNMREPQMCNVVCRLILNKKTAKEFKEKINDEYRVNM